MSYKKLNRNQWQALVAEQETSGLSQQAFCKKHRLTPSQFWYYRSLFRSVSKKPKITRKATPAIIPINLQAGLSSKAPDAGMIRLALQNGMQCAFPEGLDLKRLQQLLGVLLSC